MQRRARGSTKVWVEGKVIHGDHRGRRIGFRTANIALQHEMRSGIYAGCGFVAGVPYPAAIYVGPSRRVLEAHLVGFSGSIYGKRISVRVDRKIREVYDFKTEEELARAIADDVRAARKAYAPIMFTGIISHRSNVERVAKVRGGLAVWFKAPRVMKLRPGASVSVNGICSTVVSNRNGIAEVRYMPETLQRTTAIGFKKGIALNLEASLRLTSPLDGHIVQGHVDFAGNVWSVSTSPAQTTIAISYPPKYRKFFVEKGSVAVDGVSLTVVAVKKNSFAVSLIPYTLAYTTLGLLARGSRVNIETDILGKYMLNK